MNIDKVIQILLEDCDGDKAENFLRFLSGKLWNLYDEYLMDKIKMVECEIVWNLNIPNAKENQTYNQTVEMPVLSSDKIAGVDIVLESITGLDEETHGLLLSVAPDGKSFSITGTPSLESFRKDGATAQSTFELTLRYVFTGIEMPSDRPVLEKKVPFVTIGSSNYTGVIQIDHNHKSACKELTSIILMKGMKRIALIGGDENHVVTQSRLRGFREAYEKMGEVIDPTMLFLNLDNHVVIDKIVEEVLERKAECILCMDDAVCSRVLKKLREKNVKVPKDIRVASFYNSSVLENNVPSITSLSFDAKELGMVACKTVLDVIEGAEVETRTLLPYEVVLKESTK